MLLRAAGLIALTLGAATTVANAQAGPAFKNPSSLPPSRGYTQLVEVPAGSRLILLSGQVPLDSAGTLVGPNDFRAQATQVFHNIERGLAAAGATFRDVVKLNFYVTDIAQLGTLREVRDHFINEAAPPASTLVEVRRLFRDGIYLEVEVVAAVNP